MYGGGNIGRGFIGKVFSDSGYEVCFLDIMQPLIDEMNRRGGYTVRIVSNAETVEAPVKNVRAVNSSTEQALEEIATCDIMATAVGVNVLPKIAPVIAEGVKKRMRESGKPLDIILCENQLEADVLMRGWINERLNDEERAWAEQNLGLVEASIGRMVPPLTPEEKAKDSLLICVEPYCQLPVDKAAFKGEIPDLVGLVPYTPFGFYIKRKLFLHNMGHAMVAYFAYQQGIEYIWQAVEHKEVYDLARKAMKGSGEALIREYGEEMRANVEENIDDLLFRFGNKALKDTRGPRRRRPGAQAAPQRPAGGRGAILHRAGRRPGTDRRGHPRGAEVRPRGRRIRAGAAKGAEGTGHRLRAGALHGPEAG